MKLRNFYLAVVAVAFAWWIGFGMGQKKLAISFANWKPAVVVNKLPTMAGKPTEADFAMFWTVWDKVSKLYVDKTELDSKKMIDGAISGMVSAIGDPYTAYLPVETNKEAKEDLGGAFEGVGIQLGYKDKRLAVISPLDGTPAAAAGVKPGDLILKITDEAKKIEMATDTISVPEAVKLIRGPRGTKIKLTMFREGTEKPFELELVRDTILVKSVTLNWIDSETKKTAWVKLNRFGDRTQEEWQEAINEITKVPKDQYGGMVLDMRNNPGGYLEMAVYVAGEFLKPGKIVVVQQYGDGSQIENKVERNGRLLTGPVSVVVNGGSASAAEILAGALQDYKRAKIVGVKSFGKGSVQQPEDFTDGSGVHVTVAKWLRPSGEWLDKKGITPDTEVVWDDAKETDNFKDDPQVLKAVELLK
jgi:carboxyl-terminal processing protease